MRDNAWQMTSWLTSLGPFLKDAKKIKGPAYTHSSRDGHVYR